MARVDLAYARSLLAGGRAGAISCAWWCKRVGERLSRGPAAPRVDAAAIRDAPMRSCARPQSSRPRRWPTSIACSSPTPCRACARAPRRSCATRSTSSASPRASARDRLAARSADRQALRRRRPVSRGRRSQGLLGAGARRTPRRARGGGARLPPMLGERARARSPREIGSFLDANPRRARHPLRLAARAGDARRCTGSLPSSSPAARAAFRARVRRAAGRRARSPTAASSRRTSKIAASSRPITSSATTSGCGRSGSRSTARRGARALAGAGRARPRRRGGAAGRPRRRALRSVDGLSPLRARADAGRAPVGARRRSPVARR